MKTQQIIKDGSMFSGSVVISGIITMLQNIIVARLLGPALYGTLQLYRIIALYSTHANLGMLPAMVRDIPYYRGAKEYKKIDGVKNVTFSSNIIFAVAVSLLAIIIAFFLKAKYQISMLEISIVGLIIIAQQAFFFFQSFLLAEKKFSTRSIATIIFPLLHIGFVFVFGFFYKLPGVLAAMLFAYIGTIVYIAKTINFKPTFFFNKKETIRLIKLGFPMTANGALTNASSSVDRLMTAGLLGQIQLGYYGIAGLIKRFMDMVYVSVFMTIYPNLTEKYGETNDIKDIKNYILKPMIVSAHLAPFLFGSMIILIPLMIKLILPQYILGIIPTQIIIATCFFGCLQAGVFNFLITLKKIHKIYPLRIATIILNIIMIYLAVQLKLGLVGIASSVLLTNFIFGIFFINYFLKQYSIGISSRLKTFFYVHYPFFYMIGGLSGIFYITKIIQSLVLRTLFQLIIYFFLNIPLFIYINKKTFILGEFKKIIINLVKPKANKKI